LIKQNYFLHYNPTAGHGTPLSFSESDVMKIRKYFEYRHHVVNAALNGGMSLPDMKAR
jgi:hypothetical protein